MKAALSALQQLRSELRSLEKADMAWEVVVELAYRTADHACSDIKALVTRFESKESQIKFYKEIWPLFIAEKEYYSLLNYAVTFCPPDTPKKERKVFWDKQQLRLEKFKSQHGEFFRNIESGDTSFDETYFLTEDREASEWLGKMYARERYIKFAEEKYKELSHGRE